MASGKSIDASVRLFSRRVGIPLLAFACYASATVAPTPAFTTVAPSVLPAASSSSAAAGAGGGSDNSSSLLVVLAIVGGVVAIVGVVIVVLCGLHKKNRDKNNRVRNNLISAGVGWGTKVGGKSRTHSERENMPAPSSTTSAHPSRAASLALVAPFERRSAWLAAEDGEGVDLELGGGALGAGGGDRRSGNRNDVDIGPRHANPLYGVNRASKERTGAVAAATASPSVAGDMEEEEDGRVGVRKGFNVGSGSRDVGVGNGSRGGSVGMLAHSGAFNRETEHDNAVGGVPVIAAATAVASVAATRRSSVPAPTQTHSNSEQSSSSNPPRRRSLGDNDDQARIRRGGRTSASSSSSAAASLAAFSVRSSAEGVVAGAQSLSPLEAFVPGAKETLGVVAGLARLAAADHRGDAKDMRRRVRWCKGVVLTLERARAVLGKAAEDDVDAKRVVLEAVKEPVCCMVEIVQCYKNKHVVSEVFSSTLFRRRQTEADEAVVFAERHLSALEENTGYQQQKISKAIRAKAERMERQRQSVLLDQMEIPGTALDMIEDEVLGVGGFGTVYLADLGGGLNVAAKVVVFRRGNDDDSSSSSSSSGSSSDEVEPIEQQQQRQQQQQAREKSNPLRSRYRTYSDIQSPKVTVGSGQGGEGGEFPPVVEDPTNQKARRRAVVAKVRRLAAEGRTDARQRQAIFRELEAMKRLRGPHTVHTYGAVATLDRLVLVMEFLPGGDLLLRLRKAKRPLEERVLRQIVRDVCSGLAFLHGESFVHGDLKSANVLFDAKGRAKIADLGTSLWTQCTSRVATYSSRPGGLMSLPWAAPEVLRRQGATSKSDVYSFGVVLWECLSRKVPWEDVTDVRMLSSSVKRGDRPTVPENAPADLADLARLCWASDPSKRPTLDTVLTDVLDAVDAVGAVAR